MVSVSHMELWGPGNTFGVLLLDLDIQPTGVRIALAVVELLPLHMLDRTTFAKLAMIILER